MHFLDWALDQQDELGNLGKISKVFWQDINNGCGARYTTPKEWERHFVEKHPRSSEKLIELLTIASVEYVKSHKAE